MALRVIYCFYIVIRNQHLFCASHTMRLASSISKHDFMLACLKQPELTLEQRYYAEDFFPNVATVRDLTELQRFYVLASDLPSMQKQLKDDLAMQDFHDTRLEFMVHNCVSAKGKLFAFRELETVLAELEIFLLMTDKERRELYLHDASRLWNDNEERQLKLLDRIPRVDFTFPNNQIADLVSKYGKGMNDRMRAMLRFLTNPTYLTFQTCMGYFPDSRMLVDTFIHSQTFLIEDVGPLFELCHGRNPEAHLAKYGDVEPSFLQSLMRTPDVERAQLLFSGNERSKPVCAQYFIDRLFDTADHESLIARAYCHMVVKCGFKYVDIARKYMQMTHVNYDVNDFETLAITRVLQRCAANEQSIRACFNDPEYVKFRSERIGTRFTDVDAFLESELYEILSMNKLKFVEFVVNELFVAWHSPYLKKHLPEFIDVIAVNMCAAPDFADAMRAEDPARMRDKAYFVAACQYHAFPDLFPEAMMTYFCARFFIDRDRFFKMYEYVKLLIEVEYLSLKLGLPGRNVPESTLAKPKRDVLLLSLLSN